MTKQGAGLILSLILFLVANQSFAHVFQEADTAAVPLDWFLRDPETDKVQGVSAEKTYETLLKGKPSRPVLVAVIDSGIDIEHEDLKDIIWVNEKEIADNGIDDDKNGYVDDIHGWNFIGGKDGKNVDADTYELTREFVRLKKKYENVEEEKVSKKNKEEYEYWKKIKAKYEAVSKKANDQYNLYSSLYQNIVFGNDTLKKMMGVDRLTPAVLDSVKSNDDTILMAKSAVSLIFLNAGPDADVDNLIKELEKAVHHFEVQVKYGYNTEFDSREIVGDNYDNLYEKGYGNNDVEGPDPSHGTHVAGIIGANRKNDFGIKGIADNVRIMSLRAVPNGDERDKDVANAILYAVDNGAKIVNMSFGKDYSPQKEAVDKAVKYAESKGVLLIHAAGNDGDNIDVESNYPSRFYDNKKEAKNWLEVGAAAWGKDDDFVAPFSNYGKKHVNLFAPGVEIYSTYPNDEYQSNSGTSMASPATAGVAALLMSYFPELSVKQVRDILVESTRKFDGLKVTKPGSEEAVEFSELSSSGGLVNAYEAVKMAMRMTGKGIE